MVPYMGIMLVWWVTVSALKDFAGIRPFCCGFECEVSGQQSDCFLFLFSLLLFLLLPRPLLLCDVILFCLGMYLKALSILLAVFLAIGDFKILKIFKIIVILNSLFDHFNSGIISKSNRVESFGS